MSLASGIKLAEITPSIVAGLTPRASNVFASAPTEPAYQVNLVVRANFSAAFRIVAVTSVVPNRTTTGLPGVAPNAVNAASARAAVIEPCG